MGEVREKPLETRARVAGPDRIKFKRPELPGLAEELESMYNIMAAAGREPSEKFRRLVQWVHQEAAVLNDPEYDPDFSCDECGYGQS
jgi:hypothetical protein